MSQSKPKVAVVMGTRPEAIKLCPMVKALREHGGFEAELWSTGQHRQMLDQMLDVFNETPDIDLDLMQAGQSLAGLTARVMEAVSEALVTHKPDAVLVQGDTTTTFVTALAAHYHQIPVGHVEAGLRTEERYNPFPEEMNRRLSSRLASWHFAPTDWAGNNLITEGIPESDVLVCGNTVVDALLSIYDESYRFEADSPLASIDFDTKRVVLLTTHRRESFGEPMREALTAIRDLVNETDDLEIVFPVHLNPNVRDAVDDTIGKHERIHLIEPMSYLPFIHLMGKCHFILSDSGGIQEEAPSLGKPVLVLRETTERPEAVEVGTARLVGTSRDKIMTEARLLLNDPADYKKRSAIANPYGDGTSCKQIADFLSKRLG